MSVCVCVCVSRAFVFATLDARWRRILTHAHTCATQLLKNDFDHRWTIRNGRKLKRFSTEMNECRSFDLPLLDMAALSARRCSFYYGSKTPFHGYRVVDMKGGERRAVLRHGFAPEMEALRAELDTLGTVVEDVRAPCLSGGLVNSGEFVAAWLGMSSNVLHFQPTVEEVKALARAPALWRDAKKMQLYALVELSIYMDRTQWATFIDKCLKDQKTWKVLKQSGYTDLIRGFRTQRAVATEAQAGFVLDLGRETGAGASTDDREGMSTGDIATTHGSCESDAQVVR